MGIEQRVDDAAVVEEIAERVDDGDRAGNAGKVIKDAEHSHHPPEVKGV